MRALVFFLILANLLFWAWVQGYLGMSSNPDSQRVQQQLLAERIRIVSHDEPPTADTASREAGKANEKPVDKPAEKPAEPSEPVPAVESVKKAEDPPAESCLRLADLPADDAGRVDKVVADQFSDFRIVRTVTKEATASFWVYIPPLATKKEAEAKTAELKKLQVDDFFIIQESGPNNHAISLGLFSTREAAENYLETLKGKKVKSARIAERNGKPALVSLELSGPVARLDALRQAIGEVTSGSNPVTCGVSAKP